MSGERWRAVDKEKVLGSWLTSTGEERSERASVMCPWNRVFWKSDRFLTNARASLSSRLRFWKVLAFAVSDFRFLGMKPSRKTGDELDSYFNIFLKLIVEVPMKQDEDVARFSRRRDRAIQAYYSYADVKHVLVCIC